MLRPGDILDNKYEILKLIGKGGMSKVWLAMDRRVNRQWAVKEVSKANPKYQLTVDESKTLREIDIMRRLDHPALPRIVDVIDEEYSLCVVMDYIEGETLLELLETYGVQKEEVVVTWMLEVCDILTYLHGQNPPIIYKDLKPSNLMLNRDGHIKIIDFGIAKEYKGNKGETMPLGTEGYASPEHRSGYTDERSDIYTVGTTAYQLLTGKDPSEPPYDLLPIRSINPSLSQGLEKIIARATERDPDNRYQTAAELANALESYKKLDDDYIQTLEAKVRRGTALLILGIVLALSGVIATGASFIIDRNNYNSLVASPGGSTAAKEESLNKAIGIKPKQEAAYIALIEAYAEDGKFTEEESARFYATYNANRDQISPDVNYAIGEAYLRYYTGTTDSSARAKLLMSEPFFKAAKEGENGKKAESYVFLAECYRNYVLSDDSLVTKDVSKEDLEDLLESGKNAVLTAENEKLRLILGEAVLGLIEQEKGAVRDAGIGEGDVTSVIDEIGNTGPALQPLAVETKNSVHLTYEEGKKKKNA